MYLRRTHEAFRRHERTYETISRSKRTVSQLTVGRQGSTRYVTSVFDKNDRSGRP